MTSASRADICIIGASHVAAVKLAYDRLVDLGTQVPSVHFLARGGEGFRAIKAMPDGIMLRGPSGGARRTEPVIGYGSCKAFVVYGTARLDGALVAANGLEVPGAYPRTYCEGVLAALLAVNSSMTLARTIAKRSGKPTYLLAAPLYARAPDLAEASDKAWPRLVATAQATCAAAGVTFLPQPSETIEGGTHTHPAFARGLEEMGSLTRMENDVKHMNVDYGGLVLDAIFAATGVVATKSLSTRQRSLRPPRRA